ncbi:MAG: SDR family NAD(P)-dependent oxidoreductase [Pseudomonadota bacterium]
MTEKFKNRIWVVTGAGSGIGRALALDLHTRGAKLALSDIKLEMVEETAQLLGANSADLMVDQLDVADQDGVFAYAAKVNNHFGAAHGVINNAGVALGSGPLWTTELEDFKWLMNINFYGVLYGTKAFLPLLQDQDWGHIVNISSLFGIVGVPDQTAYNASKFAVRGMTEALRHELKRDNSSVSCTSVHPGGIKTNIARFARVAKNDVDADEANLLHKQAVSDFDKLARTTPESAAAQIINAVIKDKQRLLIGADAKFIEIVQRLFPSSYMKIMAKLMKQSEK